MRVVTHDSDVLVPGADLDELLYPRLVAVEGIDALDHDQGVLSIAFLQHPIQRFGAVVVEETNLGRTHRRPRSQERAVEDAGMAQVVEDDRRVLVGQRLDGPHHRLVSGREDQGLFEAVPSRQPLLELDVQRRRCLNTRRAQPAGKLIHRCFGCFFGLRVVGQAEVVVRAEVDDGFTADRRMETPGFESPKIRIDLLSLGVAHPLQLCMRLLGNPAH